VDKNVRKQAKETGFLGMSWYVLRDFVGGISMATMLSPASRRLGRYELVSYLGSGGMSDVYVALHTGLRKRVAIKLLRPSLRSDREASARFLREGECAASVRHPNVVDVCDLGVDSGVPYLVMELLEGETLAQRLSREGPLGVEAAIDLLLPILDAVTAVHAAGILHRDVKPANIVLARGLDGRLSPKLVDFGIARMIAREQDDAHVRGPLGTPHYMAPEQARGEMVDERADQYALGSVLFEMLSGREPYLGETVDQVLSEVARGKFPRLSSLRPDLAGTLEDVLARATQRSPSQRYRSVDAFTYALLPFASERTRQLWLTRDDRDAVCMAQLLGTGMRPSVPVNVLGSAAPSTAARRLGRFSLRALAGSAVLGLGLMAGMGVTRGFAESPKVAAIRELPPPVERIPEARPSLAPAPSRTVRLEPTEATAALDGSEIGRGTFTLPELAPGLHELRISAPGHVARVVLFRDALPDPLIRLESRKKR
jgi:tRNA A-37 threonylcarbamoyl transferase component Bud32